MNTFAFVQITIFFSLLEFRCTICCSQLLWSAPGTGLNRKHNLLGPNLGSVCMKVKRYLLFGHQLMTLPMSLPPPILKALQWFILYPRSHWAPLL